MPRHLALWVALGLSLSSEPARATSMEIFARGSMSKNFLSTSSYIISVSAATGVAFTLIPRLRLEARYTNASSLQNQLDISTPGISGTLSDVLTQTSIYSLGLDI